MQTPNGVVEYEGSARIDGVPGTAAPVALTFLNAAGTKTGKVFPTDNQILGQLANMSFSPSSDYSDYYDLG